MSVIHTPAGDKLSYTSEEIDRRLGLIGDWATLLWENANPTSSYIGGQVAVDYRDYSFLLIEFRITTTSNNYTIGFVDCNSYNYTYPFYPDSRINWRGVSAVEGKSMLSFSNGRHIQTYGTDATDASYMIPFRIYGIR